VTLLAHSLLLIAPADVIAATLSIVAVLRYWFCEA
jgi:hypothetical protein